jgi:hypothetical protein
LNSDGSKEFASTIKIAPTSGKEETCPKEFLFGKIVGDCASDCRLTSARYSTQPKDTRTLRIFAPFIDLLEEVDSGFWKTLRLLLPNLGVESSTISIRKLL